MNRVIVFLATVFISMFFISLTGASAVCNNTNYSKTQTIVAGQVYDVTKNSTPIDWAKVTITCEHNGTNHTQYTKTDLHGYYGVVYPNTQCTFGDKVNVLAEKDSMKGFGSGYVDKHLGGPCVGIDIAFVFVPVVPEFGLIVGALTILSAAGIFFYVRRG
jgi:hypothetical protein